MTKEELIRFISDAISSVLLLGALIILPLYHMGILALLLLMTYGMSFFLFAAGGGADSEIWTFEGWYAFFDMATYTMFFIIGGLILLLICSYFMQCNLIKVFFEDMIWK